MAQTNFSNLTTEQKTVWARQTWMQARNANYFNRFSGGQDSLVHRITELTRDEKGSRAVITLVADLEGDGVAGDNQQEGNEEAIRAFDKVINIDQLRHANVSEGRMAEQGTVVRFRETSQNVLAHWLGDRLTQMMFLTLSGVAYTQTNAGGTRVGSQLPQLAYAADVAAPTANRHFNWDDSASDLVAANTATIAADDTLKYNTLILMKAKAQSELMRPIRGDSSGDGMEMYHVFVTPGGMADLKLDPTFHAALKDAMPRTPNSPVFKGANTYFVDGMAIHVHNHVYKADNWGAGANIKGQAVLMCGAQALGFADIGDPFWVEKMFDYENRPGISYGKICGLLKPQFKSSVTGAVEDFSVIRINTARSL